MTVRDAVRTTALIAAKDLRVEWRSKVGLNQVLPFAATVMVIFAFALDRFPNAPTPEGRREGSLLQTVAPGLVWLATLFSLLLLVQRTFSVESEDGALDALRAAGIDAGAMFWGKTLALAAQLAVLEALLLGTAVVLYGVELRWSGMVLLGATWLAATFGLAAVGTLYGGLAAGARGRETLLPLLLLPVVAPVLIGATQRSKQRSASQGRTSRRAGPRSASWRCSPSPSVPGERWPSARSSTSRRQVGQRVQASDDGSAAVTSTSIPSPRPRRRRPARPRRRPACSVPPRSSASPGSWRSGWASRRPTRTSASRCGSCTCTSPRRGWRTSRSSSPRWPRRSTCCPSGTRSAGTASPAPAPRSACSSWGSRSSSARCGVA